MSHTTETKHDHYYRFFVVETLWPCNLHRNLRQFVSNTTNNDIAAHFLLLQHFWPCLNNVFTSMKCLFHIDGLFQKRKDSPTSVKMGRRTPAPPRGGTTLWQPLTTTIPQKWGEIPFTTTSVTGISTQCTVCSTYSNYRPFWNLWHTMHWKHSNILHYKQHQFVVDTVNSGVNPDVSLLQLLNHVNNGLH